MIKFTLLDPDTLRRALDELDAAETAPADHAERLRDLTAGITAAERRLDRLAERLGDEEDNDVAASIQRTMTETSRQLGALRRSRETLLASRPADFARWRLAIEELAEAVRQGFGLLTVPETRRIFELLRLRGKLTPDPTGERFGRNEHNRFRPEFECILTPNSVPRMCISSTWVRPLTSG